jgi:hypothetical protein
MNDLMGILINLVSMTFDYAGMFLSFLSDEGIRLAVDGGVMCAFALGAVTTGNITKGVRAGVRRWNGSISNRQGNIYNLVKVIQEHQPQWPISADLLKQLVDNHIQLEKLISRCRTTEASKMDRQLRDVLLRSTVDLCRIHVKAWAYGLFSSGVMKAEDVYRLGFLLPGDIGGRHQRSEAIDIRPEVMVRVINADFIRVVITRAADKNAAQAARGWPHGVRNAVIVIVAADGKTEVSRHHTTRMYNNIQMPEGSHGKQFIIKASFLKHVDDEPRFGSEPTFSMPLTTEDLLANSTKQEEQQREIERLQHEIERLSRELNEARR